MKCCQESEWYVAADVFFPPCNPQDFINVWTGQTPVHPGLGDPSVSNRKQNPQLLMRFRTSALELCFPTTFSCTWMFLLFHKQPSTLCYVHYEYRQSSLYWEGSGFHLNFLLNIEKIFPCFYMTTSFCATTAPCTNICFHFGWNLIFLHRALISIWSSTLGVN